MGFSAGLAFVIASIACIGAAQSQSFNCRYAHFADEKLICASPELARLDNELAAVFGRAMYRLPRREQNLLDRREDAWVIERRRCGSDFACIAERYRSRIEQLSQFAAREPGRSVAPLPAVTESAAPPARRSNRTAAQPAEDQEPAPARRSAGASPMPTARPGQVEQSSGTPRTSTASKAAPETAAKTVVRPASEPPVAPASGGSLPATHPTIRWSDPPPAR